jgi:hypothetical protein
MKRQEHELQSLRQWNLAAQNWLEVWFRAGKTDEYSSRSQIMLRGCLEGLG